MVNSAMPLSHYINKSKNTLCCFFFSCLLMLHLWNQFMLCLKDHLKQSALENHHCNNCAQAQTPNIVWANYHWLWPSVSQYIRALTLLVVSLTTIDSVWIVCADTRQHLILSNKEEQFLNFTFVLQNCPSWDSCLQALMSHYVIKEKKKAEK